jgi:CubicO group peptidase (beta-lactamase class C family)
MTIFSELGFTLMRERMKHFHVIGLGIALIDNGFLSNAEAFGEIEVGTNNQITNSTIFNACSISKLVEP